MRSYTLAEIDEMRSLVKERMSPSGPYYEKEQIVRIEEALRTLMTNGTSLDELREEKRARDEAARQRFARVCREVDAAVEEIKGCPVCGSPKRNGGWGGMNNGRNYSTIQFECRGTGYIANDDHVPRPLKMNDAWCGKKKRPMDYVAPVDQLFKR